MSISEAQTLLKNCARNFERIKRKPSYEFDEDLIFSSRIIHYEFAFGTFL
jgi:hypothetical protein